MKDQIGLYLGSDSVGAAHLKSKNIVSFSQLDFSFESENPEDLNEDIKWGASIIKALRYAKVDMPTEAYIALSDKDFIFRFFNIPLMKKSQIDSALFYEAEKYIPFKLEELAFTYDYIRLPKENKISVSFVGLRKSNLDLIKNRLKGIDVKPVAIEPASVSLARLLKEEKDIAKFKNYAILDFTSSEGHLTFFQNDLIVLNRYLILAKKDEKIDIEKFVETVNFSFQFFKREFKSGNLEKLILVGKATEELISSLSDIVQVEIKAITPSDLISRKQATVESAKAMGVAIRDYAKAYKFKPILKEAVKPEESEEVLTAPPPPLNWAAIGSAFVIGALIPFFMFIYTNNQIKLEEYELKQKKEKMEIPKEMQDLSRKEMDQELQNQISKNKALNKTKESLLRLADFLEVLSSSQEVLPQGVWFDNINIRKQRGNLVGKFEGFAFRDDNYQERRTIDKLIANLKKSDAVNSIFSEVRINSSSRRKMKDFEVTTFSLNLSK